MASKDVIEDLGLGSDSEDESVVEKEDAFSLAPASAVDAPGPVPAAPTAPSTATTTTALGRPEGPEGEEADARDSGISLFRPLVPALPHY